jgi:hypothetical protein
MGAKLDYNEVRPENKWKILRTQWRFGIWAIYTSLGPMMGGFDFVAGALLVSMVLPCTHFTNGSPLSNSNMEFRFQHCLVAI